MKCVPTESHNTILGIMEMRKQWQSCVNAKANKTRKHLRKIKLCSMRTDFASSRAKGQSTLQSDDLEVLNVVSVESHITEYFVSSEAYQ